MNREKKLLLGLVGHAALGLLASACAEAPADTASEESEVIIGSAYHCKATCNWSSAKDTKGGWAADWTSCVKTSSDIWKDAPQACHEAYLRQPGLPETPPQEDSDFKAFNLSCSYAGGCDLK
jgi:hypothetical protein